MKKNKPTPKGRAERPTQKANSEERTPRSRGTKPASSDRGAKPASGGRSARPSGPTSYKGKRFTSNKGKPAHKPQAPNPDGLVRLNRYIASSGICSRREADTLISSGIVTVNGKIVSALGSKVAPTDIVKIGDDRLKMEKQQYVLLNKPKDFITTSKDPQNRRTVMELVRRASKERIMPVGRLDRATTGVLLFTNDGDLTKKMTHPSHGCEKLYHVFLHKPILAEHLDQIRNGFDLDDGHIQADEVSFAGKNKDKKQVGIKLHSGRNRIVRRIFEHFGYKVVKLDRVMFGGLTKKDLSRGQWRHLSELEVRSLKNSIA